MIYGLLPNPKWTVAAIMLSRGPGFPDFSGGAQVCLGRGLEALRLRVFGAVKTDKASYRGSRAPKPQ